MKRLLLIRMSALGDVAMLTAVLREAATLHPDCDYTLLSLPKMEELLMDMPTNVHFIGWNPKQDKRPNICWSDFDMVLDAHRVWRSLRLDLAALLHGLPVRTIGKAHLRKWLIVHGMKIAIPTMISRYRKLLDVPESAEQALNPDDIRRNGVGIAPFAAHATKIYPLHRMEEVVAALSQTEPVVLFGGGEKELVILRDWAAHYPNVTVSTGGLRADIERMKTLRLVLTMDSSNLHLASLAGTRAISVWGATSPAMGFLGYGQSPDDCIMSGLKCQPCSAYGKRPCRLHDQSCLSIAPQQIIHACQP